MKLLCMLALGTVLLASCRPQASVLEPEVLPPIAEEKPQVERAAFTDDQRAALQHMLEEIQGRKPYITDQEALTEEQEEDTESVFYVGSLENIVDPIVTEEQVPRELSLIYLAQMDLTGSDFLLEKVMEENDAYTRHAISYRSNELLISGILNIPNGEGPFPLAVLNHGYIDPAYYTRGRGLKREQDFLARHGYAVLHADYRGHAASDPSPNTSKVYDGMLEYSMDIINGIQAIQEAALPQIDPDRIGMLGHSMGGGISMIVSATHPQLVDATVLYAPVSSDAWENFDRWKAEREEGDRTLEVLRTNIKNPNAWHLLSPRNYLYRTKMPFLVFHGARDSDVPIEWSALTVAALTALDKEVEYVTYPNEKHEFITQWEDFMMRTVEFFDANI